VVLWGMGSGGRGGGGVRVRSFMVGGVRGLVGVAVRALVLIFVHSHYSALLAKTFWRFSQGTG
jgi:hypothetical protein